MLLAVFCSSVVKKHNNHVQTDSARGVQLCAARKLAFLHTIGPRMRCG